MKQLVAGFLLAGMSFTTVVMADNYDHIVEVQQRLTELGYKPGGADGIWGPKTRNAVAFFQRHQGELDANGLLSDRTMVLLGLMEAPPEEASAEAQPAAEVMVIKEAHQPAELAPEEAPYWPTLFAKPSPLRGTITKSSLEPITPSLIDKDRQLFEDQHAQSGKDNSAAESNAWPLSFSFRAGVVTGGDSAFTTLAGGAGVTDPNMDAGGLYDAALAVDLGIGESPLSVQLAAGYRVEEENNGTVTARSSAIPVNLTFFYNMNKFRVGLGWVRHIDPTLYLADGTTVHADTTGKDADGAAFEVTYMPSGKGGLMLGARYEFIEYDGDVDASTTGLYLGVGF